MNNKSNNYQFVCDYKINTSVYTNQIYYLCLIKYAIQQTVL